MVLEVLLEVVLEVLEVLLELLSLFLECFLKSYRPQEKTVYLECCVESDVQLQIMCSGPQYRNYEKPKNLKVHCTEARRPGLPVIVRTW